MPISTKKRIGVSRHQDITPELQAALNNGTIEAATLAEELSINFAVHARYSFPDMPDSIIQQIEALQSLPIVKRMRALGQLLLTYEGAEGVLRYSTHVSNIVRGWGCFMISEQQNIPLSSLFEQIYPCAADTHYGVREWAWLAIRPHVIDQLDAALPTLKMWAQDTDENIRRFCCELVRPRGVWCSHIERFKTEPELFLPVLELLKADSSRYVQNSVANWLNDASKSKPEWVQAVCTKWLDAQPSASTQYICKRALRSLAK